MRLWPDSFHSSNPRSVVVVAFITRRPHGDPLKAWFDDRQAPRRTPTGHWVPPGARLPAVHVVDAAISLLVGRGATVGSVQHAGSVTLTRQVNV
ncbi:MAG: hypothetical protein QOJ26_867, partial [Thermoplasmata archaeon]|nr:hypothetical protein [Thermoplasmata archaeon]